MRQVIVLGFLAACGRIGFGGSAAIDGGPDGGTTVALCDVRAAGTLALGAETVTRIRAVAGQTGFVVALETSAQNVYVARVDATVDLHLPLADGYTLDGIARIGDRIFVRAATGGTAYTKLLDPSFDTYATVEGADEAPIDPPLAPRANGAGLRINIFGGLLDIAEMNSDGSLTGVASPYQPPAKAATIAGDRVVTVDTGGCETFLVGNDGTVSQVHRRDTCSEPQLAVLDSRRAILVHRAAPATVQVYLIPNDPQASGIASSLGDAIEPRVAAIGETAWALYRKGNGVELARFDAELASMTAALPEVTGPFELIPTAAFWVEGTTLRVGTPCLR